MHFTVVVTALAAMLREEFTLHGATASIGGCAVFIVVNGDARRELGAVMLPAGACVDCGPPGAG